MTYFPLNTIVSGVFIGNYFQQSHPWTHIIPDEGSEMHRSSFMLPKNSSLTPLVSKISMHMLQFGFVDYFQKKYGLLYVHKEVKHFHSVNIDQLAYSIFTIFGLFSLAFFILCFENVLFYGKRQNLTFFGINGSFDWFQAQPIGRLAKNYILRS